MQCRRATVEDLPAICELARELNRSHHAAWPAIFAPDSGASHDELHWRQSVLGSANASFVAELESQVVGFITLSVIHEDHILVQPGRYARINSVCVAPTARGVGIGSRLVAVAEEWSVAQGASDLRLVVYEFNASAVRLYRELGFTVRSLAMGKPLARGVV